ncbi:integrase, catalytic region, zinc finger, CCHC-type containing protein, partial [Tanacetum coccineum]
SRSAHLNYLGHLKESVETVREIVEEARVVGKSKKFSHRPKSENTNMEVLHTLHMDLCGPMRVQSINGKKYILVIVGDYSRFTWVKFLRSNDETQSLYMIRSLILHFSEYLVLYAIL